MQDTKINNRYFEYDMSDRETIKIANEKQIAQIKDNILIYYGKSNYSMFSYIVLHLISLIYEC